MDWARFVLMILAGICWFMSGYLHGARSERRFWHRHVIQCDESFDSMFNLAKEVCDTNTRMSADYENLRSAYETAYEILKDNDLLPGGEPDDSEPADEGAEEVA